MMDAENSADSSHSHPFEIELTGRLLEVSIFASSYCLKDPSADLATEALDTTTEAKVKVDLHRRLLSLNVKRGGTMSEVREALP